MRVKAVLLAVVAAAVMAGCGRKGADSVDDAAVQAISEAVADGMNEPGAAILQLIKARAGPSPIGLEALQLTLDQRQIPLDAWLFTRNYIGLVEPVATPGHPTFLVSAAAEKLAQGDPVWFEAGAAEPDHVDCQTPDALEAAGCEVDITVSPSLTPAGLAIAGQQSLPSIKVHALVVAGGEGWEVRSLRTEGPTLHDAALNALMGNEQAREANRNRVFADLDARGGGLSASPMGIAAAPDLVQSGQITFEVAPVEPVIGDNPLAPVRKGPAVP